MVKYYVYAHRNPINNKIFYIGKGTGKRALETVGRTDAWRSIYSELKDAGLAHTVEYLHICDSEREAIDLEAIEIAKRPELVNVRGTIAKIDQASESELRVILKEIGNDIFNARIEHNLTKSAMSKALHVNRFTYSKIEAGDGKYEFTTLLRILKALGLRFRITT